MYASLSTSTAPLIDVLNASLNGVILLQPLQNTDGVITDFDFIFINDRAFHQSSLLTDWQEGNTLREFDSVTGRLGLFDQCVEVAQTGEPFHTVEYLPDADEWYELGVARVGEQVMLTFQNVTEGQRALRHMQRQRDLLQSILDTSPAGIVLYQAIRSQKNLSTNEPEAGQIIDFEYILTNPRNAQTTGRSVAEMTGNRLSVISPTAHQSDFFRLLVEVTESGNPRQVTFPFEGDGIKGWFEASLVRQGDGVLFIFLDVSALKASEQRQQQQAVLLQTVMDASQTALSLHKAIRQPGANGQPGAIRDFQTILTNQQARLAWEPQTEQFLNRTFWEMRPGLQSDTDFERYVRVVETGQPDSWEMQSPQGDRWYKLLVAKADDGVVIAAVDITESHEYQQRLETANATLQRLNEKLQRFASVASHDLQEPLRKVKFYSDVLLHDYASVLDEDGQHLLSTMRGAAERMQRLIDNLLFYAKLEANHADFEPVALTDIINQVLDDLSVSTKGAIIEVGALPQVNGDRLQLGQLFQNLISNALKYRRADVPLHVRINADQLPYAELPQPLLNSAEPGTDLVWRINVADNGIGFDPKHVDRIFQTFQRLPNQSGGTGLGLAICKQVAENHGGYLTATGRPNHGATFTLYLPT